MTAALRQLAARQRAGSALFDPLSDIAWHSAYWAEDPDWTNPGDGNQVTSFRDGSGNGRTLTAPGTGPTFTASVAVMNSRPALTYTSVANRRLTAASFTTIAQPFSLVFVVRYNAPTNGPSSRLFDNAGIGTGRAIAGNNGGAGFIMLNETLVNSTPTPPAPSSTRALNVFKFQGSSSWVESNGVRSSNVNPGTAGLGGIGIASDGASSHFVGNIAFIGVYAGDVTTDAAWSDYETWCADLYDITIA
jgi:hypothetical protein